MRSERLFAGLLWSVSMGVCALLVWIVVDLAWRGLGDLSLEFLTANPRDAGRAGGIWSLLVSTAWIVGTAAAVALPIGLFSAVLLAEGAHQSARFARLVRGSLDMLSAVPSIVFGLFGNAFFCIALGMGYSILSGGLTLTCMILPILIRTIEEALRSVPDEQRLAASALGLSRTTTLTHVLLPAAAPGVAVGFVLGIGRALSETAALIFTSGYVTRTPHDLLDSGRALSVHIYDLAMNIPGGNGRAYTSALVLVLLLFVLNGIVRLGARRFTARLAS
jgi:phosphate transport system permease protein